MFANFKNLTLRAAKSKDARPEAAESEDANPKEQKECWRFDEKAPRFYPKSFADTPKFKQEAMADVVSTYADSAVETFLTRFPELNLGTEGVTAVKESVQTELSKCILAAWLEESQTPSDQKKKKKQMKKASKPLSDAEINEIHNDITSPMYEFVCRVSVDTADDIDEPLVFKFAAINPESSVRGTHEEAEQSSAAADAATDEAGSDGSADAARGEAGGSPLTADTASGDHAGSASAKKKAEPTLDYDRNISTTSRFFSVLETITLKRSLIMILDDVTISSDT